MNASPFKWLLLAVIASMTLCLTIPSRSLADDNIFPITKGSTWKFTGTAATSKMAMDATITSVKTDKGVSSVLFDWTVNGKTSQKETYLVSKQGVSRSQAGVTGTETINPPIPILKFPVKIGQSWTWKGSLKGGQKPMPASAILKVLSLDDVNTVAGKYKAYCVNLSLTITQGANTMTIQNKYWFAKGAGLVKQAMTMPGPNGKSLLVEGSVISVKIQK